MAIPFKYNRRSLFVRRVSNLMTGGAVAIVVGVFVAAMAMVGGLNSAIRDTSSPDNLIVIRSGANSESTSLIALDQLDALKFLPAIHRDAAGNPLISPELTSQVFMPAADHTLDTLPLRGVLPLSKEVHDRVHIISGRMFEPGLSEVMIGKLIVNQYPGCSVGSNLRLGRRTWKVVGVFEAGGSSFESEVWADLHSLQEDSRRGSSFNSIRLKLEPGADIPSLVQRIASDPRINLHAQTESEYYREQSTITARLRVLGLLVAGVMAFAAIFAAMNTMYAAVSARTTEIGTLRALGFSPAAIMTSFLLESSALALAAGVVGIILALPINGFSTKFNGAISSPTLAFSFHVTGTIILQALVFALLIGLAGGWLPARQAMRLSVVNALRRT
ncbi:MAG TPA: ABC transporter permease [Methylomirabilota bacterium]|jgi:ABC-type lipoprotein release transport system permease subunit|nr:ABC transporter permease [Methylomirabilota bacterium]